MSADIDTIRKYFPYPDPRPGQLECCKELLDYHLDDGITDIILQGPTGSGKSGIAMCIARYLRGERGYTGFISTPLKTLQDQYERDPFFVDRLRAIKGRAAYPCELMGGATKKGKGDDDGAYLHYCSDELSSPDECFNQRKCCADRGVCDFTNAVLAAQPHPIVLINSHALIYHQLPFADYFTPRDFLILDECHMAEDLLMGLFSFRLDENIYKKYELHEDGIVWEGPPRATTGRGPHIYKPTTRFLTKLEAILDVLNERYVDLGTSMKESELSALNSLMMNIREYVVNHSLWVCDVSDEWDERGQLKPPAFRFKPLRSAQYAHYLTDKGTKVRFYMSATILGDGSTFRKTLGIKKETSVYKELPSQFPVENGPIIYLNETGIKSLSHNSIDNNLQAMAYVVDRLADKYPNTKGVIHSHTKKTANYLAEHCRCRHRILTHTTANRGEVLKQFITSDQPLILVSPSMAEGIDLKDDLARWQVICKLPFMFLGDAQVAERMKDKLDGQRWYDWRAALKIVQSVGRIVRHRFDKGYTFVIDPGFDRWFEKVKKGLPKHFVDAVRFDITLDNLPEEIK